MSARQLRLIAFVEDSVNNKGKMLQDLFLKTLCNERVSVSMFLVSGIKLVGHIESYDPYVVMLRGATLQVIYKHAISTILLAHDFKWSGEKDDSGQ